MTVGELKGKLAEFPDSAEVYTEGGMTDIEDVMLDDEGDLAIGPFLNDSDENDFEDDDEDEDEDE